MTPGSIEPSESGLVVSTAVGWRYLGNAMDNQASRLWSLSDEVRDGFAENVVESWGLETSHIPLDHLAQSFRRSNTLLHRWTESHASVWQEGPVTYGAVSGVAVIAEQRIKSSSIIALSTSAGKISAHQVVVTTFADNDDRHAEALRNVATGTATLETALDD